MTINILSLFKVNLSNIPNLTEIITANLRDITTVNQTVSKIITEMRNKNMWTSGN